MHEATVITILIMRQIIIFKVIIFIRLVKVIKQLSQPVWFCNMDHEKSSGWLKFIIAFGSIGVITLENVKNYGGIDVNLKTNSGNPTRLTKDGILTNICIPFKSFVFSCPIQN